MDLAAFADIAALLQKEPGRAAFALRDMILRLQDAFSAIERARFPVIAEIHGACIGGGIDLITACDLRVASEEAYFSIEEIHIGMAADVGTLQRLPHLMPSGLVRELAYTGRRLPAAEAHHAGLVNAVFSDQGAMLEAVMGIARTIASKSPLAITGTKDMLNYTRDHSVGDALNYMQVWQAGMFLTPDLMEAITAQQQKREPKFADLLPAKKLVRKGRR